MIKNIPCLTHNYLLFFKLLFNNCQILGVPNQVKEHHQLPSDSIPSPTVHTISFFALSV